MASQTSLATTETQPSRHMTPHCCFFIPPTLLKTILDNGQTSEPTRAAVEKSYNHCCKLHDGRKLRNAAIAQAQPHSFTGRSSIIPPNIFQAIATSSDSSDTQKERAQHNLKTAQAMHAARADRVTAAAATKLEPAKVVHRVIYDSQKGKKLRKILLFDEAKGNVNVLRDADGRRVYDYFGYAYEFFAKVFDRHSMDDRNMDLIGSVHHDDEPPEPGMDNAFWDGDEMAFGDGDGEVFGTFTKNLDIVGHELTHGVVQFTANLAFEFQAGALNESMADVFGSMIKQYFGPKGKVLAKDADWLVGEGIFLPAITNAKALRSLKAPGTAYNNPIIGKDPQPADMDGYIILDNTPGGDWGGVHINSGIPNRAFYLTAFGLGGYSWDKAGKIWYAALKDKSLRGVNTKAAFKPFADLTVKYAKSLFDEATEKVVREAWTNVRVFRASRDDL